MASVAGCLSCNVVCKLAWRGGAIVASRTSTSGNAGVVEFCTCKSSGCVAGIAIQLGLYVAGRLHNVCPRQQQAARVATRTVFRRSLEHAIDVTGFTTRIGVHARQGETGLKVVKISGSDLGKSSGGAERQHQGQQPFE